MFVKVIGCTLVLMSCSMLGYSCKFKSQRKLMALENIIACMQIFETEIRCCMSDILSATKKMLTVSCADNTLLFEGFLDKAQKSDGIPLSEVWKANINSSTLNCCYNDKELELFSQFGSVLGSGDVETQLNNINIFCARITDRINSLKEKNKKSDDVLAKMGIYAGILLVIFLI